MEISSEINTETYRCLWAIHPIEKSIWSEQFVCLENGLIDEWKKVCIIHPYLNDYHQISIIIENNRLNSRLAKFFDKSKLFSIVWNWKQNAFDSLAKPTKKKKKKKTSSRTNNDECKTIDNNNFTHDDNDRMNKRRITLTRNINTQLVQCVSLKEYVGLSFNGNWSVTIT